MPLKLSSTPVQLLEFNLPTIPIFLGGRKLFFFLTKPKNYQGRKIESTCESGQGEGKRIEAGERGGHAVNIQSTVPQVKVTQTTEAHKLPQVINTLQKGDYFGEKALVR